MEHENLIVITQIDHHRYNGLIVQQTTSRKGGVGGASGLKQPKGTFLRGPPGVTVSYQPKGGNIFVGNSFFSR